MNNLPYDKNLIGKFIAIGAESIVYRYGTDKVVKFPTFFSPRYLSNPRAYCQELISGLETLKKYIGQNLNQSRIYFYEHKGRQKYAIIEPFIDGSALSKNDLSNENVKSQFLKILQAKKNMEEKERIFIDLFGSWGLWFWGRWKIPNLLLEKNSKKLYLVDIGTAKLNDNRFFIKILIKLAKRIQDSLLKLYLP